MISTFAADQLKSLIERIERLEEEKENLASDIRTVYTEAKGSGYDTKTLKKIIRLRKMNQQERFEQEELLDLYMSAIGMKPSSADHEA